MCHKIYEKIAILIRHKKYFQKIGVGPTYPFSLSFFTQTFLVYGLSIFIQTTAYVLSFQGMAGFRTCCAWASDAFVG
jgi:hypothetical protein